MTLNLVGAYSGAHTGTHNCQECTAGGHQSVGGFLLNHANEIFLTGMTLAPIIYNFAQNTQVTHYTNSIKVSMYLVCTNKLALKLISSAGIIGVVALAYKYFANEVQPYEHEHDDKCGHPKNENGELADRGAEELTGAEHDYSVVEQFDYP